MPNAASLMLMRDVQRYLDSTTNSRLPFARTRYEYLLQRRDQLFDKLRNGALAINAASLVAVLTALGTDTIISGKFGIRVGDLAFGACAFVSGIALAGVGFWIESQRTRVEAATQFDRVSRHEHLRAMLDTVFDENNNSKLSEAMEAVHKLPPADFGHSKIEIAATSFAGGAWLAGSSLLCWRMSLLIHWWG